MLTLQQLKGGNIMTEEKWIDFVIANNNMYFTPIEIYLKHNCPNKYSKEDELKIQSKIKDILIDFTKINIQVLNHLYDIGFRLIDELFDNVYQKNIEIKRLKKEFDNYTLFIDIDVDYRLNGVSYLQITVEENNNSYGYGFDKPTIKEIEWALKEIKEKDNKRYFIKPLT